MKNLFTILIFIPLLVFELNDNNLHDYPFSLSYDAIVTNKDGAGLYYYNDKMEFVEIQRIPYNTKVRIVNEEYDMFNKKESHLEEGEEAYDGVVFANAGTLYYDDSDKYYEGYFLVDDISTTNKNYTFKSNDVKETINLKIKKDLEIRKGPAEAYESTGVTIKKGKTIKAKLIKVNSDYNTIDDSTIKVRKVITDWYYVEYGGVKGYINNYDNTHKNYTKRSFDPSLVVKKIEEIKEEPIIENKETVNTNKKVNIPLIVCISILIVCVVIIIIKKVKNKKISI